MPQVVQPQPTGLQQAIQGFQTAFQQAQQRQLEQQKLDILREQFKSEQRNQFAQFLLENGTAKDVEEAFSLADAVVQGNFDPIKVRNFNKLSEKKKKQFIKEASESDKLFLERNSALLEIPEAPVDTAKVSPITSTTAFTPETAPAVTREAVTQIPQLLKKAAKPKVPAAQQAITAARTFPQIPAQVPLAAEQALPQQFRPFTTATQAPQQVLGAVRSALPNIPLFQALPENIRNIILKGRQQTGVPGAF